MKFKIYEDSDNYTCQVIRLPNKEAVPELDNLVKVSYQGSSCLISRSSTPEELYLYFPVECQLSPAYLKRNNLYRDSTLNEDTTQNGFFDESGRVKAVKFKTITSSGFIAPVSTLPNSEGIMLGDEFNEIDGVEICRKYIRPNNGSKMTIKQERECAHDVIRPKMVPEHMSTNHLFKYANHLKLTDHIAVTVKLHGTSARFFNTLVKRKLSILEKIAKFFGAKVLTEHYEYVSASRRMVKSIGFELNPDKRHYYNSEDLWSAVGERCFRGKLDAGEAVYCEIIGKTYGGSDIQSGYTYGFDKPMVYVYRISNITLNGIEKDLSYLQMKERAAQLGVDCCPELTYSTVEDFIKRFAGGDVKKDDIAVCLDRIFNGQKVGPIQLDGLLNHASCLDPTVIEEGFCVRKDTCTRPLIYKVKSSEFILHETGLHDKGEEIVE